MIRDLRSKEKSEKDERDAQVAATHAAALAQVREQLAEKDEALNKLSARLEESARLAQREQQLMMTAFYEAGLEMQRIKGAGRAGNSGGQSFLQRQRAAANKRDRL